MAKLCTKALVIVGPLIAALSAVAANAPALSQTTGCTDGQNRWLLIQNLKPMAIYLIKHRPPYVGGAWSDDRLGNSATPAGSSVLILMPNTNCECRADIQITMESGNNAELTYNSVNYCSRTNGPRASMIVD